MTANPENIIVNSCAYTPVYLLQNPGDTQPRSYVITQNNQEVQKPITDNLKRFYESSGNLENTTVYNDVENNSIPKRLKQESVKVGNNLKLASFLVPKNNISKQQYVLANNVALMPTASTSSNTVSVNTNTTQRIDMDRKIVKLDHSLDVLRHRSQGRTLPKMKPKDKKPILSKPTSVHLLKLGATYHSLNQLNDYQMEIVNQALKGIGDPEKIPPQPTYDPVTNTRFIYRVVSPKDLTIVGTNKIVYKERKHEIKKGNIKEVAKNNMDCDANEVISQPTEPKMTRSGRKIKVPNQMVPEKIMMQRSRKHTVHCIKCLVEFPSIYGLNKHYEKHIQNNTHTNLFHCLLDIVKNNSNKDKANIFIQQLEQFAENLKLLLPCLLKKIDGIEGKLCSIKDNVGRLFGMNPGEYKFNMDALNCIKDKDGYCKHNQQKNKQFNLDISKPSQLWLSKHNEEIANTENEMGDCARINPIDKWPKVSKRVWKYRQKQNGNVKKIRLASENTDTIIELGCEDLSEFNNSESAINTTQMKTIPVLDDKNQMSEAIENQAGTEKNVNEVSKKIKSTHAQFHSAHFDIRSSPIKPSSATFRKFQITPDRINTKYVQIIRPLTLDTETKETREIPQTDVNNSLNLQGIFTDAHVACQETNIRDNLINDNAKKWTVTAPSTNEVHDNYIKLNNVTESMLNSTNDDINQTTPTVNSDINQTEHLVTNDNPIPSNSGQSLTNILDSFFNDFLTFNDFC